MNNRLFRPLIVIPCLLLTVMLFNITYLTLHKGSILNDTCVSVLRTQEFNSHFMSTETATLVMNPDHSGYIAFSGSMKSNDKIMTLFREIRFTYEKESDDIYKISDIETVKHLRDNAPDTLVDSVFFSTSHEKARYMTVSKIMNAYVIGNLHSPVFMCVVK